MNQKSLVGLAVIGAAAAAYTLYRQPKLRRKLEANAYDAMATALMPLARMTGKTRRTLGQRFSFGKQRLARDAQEFREKIATERVKEMAGL